MNSWVDVTHICLSGTKQPDQLLGINNMWWLGNAVSTFWTLQVFSWKHFADEKISENLNCLIILFSVEFLSPGIIKLKVFHYCFLNNIITFRELIWAEVKFKSIFHINNPTSVQLRYWLWDFLPPEVILSGSPASHWPSPFQGSINCTNLQPKLTYLELAFAIIFCIFL